MAEGGDNPGRLSTVTMSMEELRTLYPSSTDEGSSGEEASNPGASKIARKCESKEIVSYQNEQQAGLYGRKPLELANTAGHTLFAGQMFPSRYVVFVLARLYTCVSLFLLLT